jgi:glycosyltransferase involved in cell wall biosynthesis
LNNFPPPSEGLCVWPWSADPSIAPQVSLPDGRHWPTISIITPNYNGGRFLEETIRSVLLQGYPNLEFIVIDGGSTDNSTEIIRRYEPWISYWISEKDSGQSEAINKGLMRATGEVVAYLNSDDLYLPGALFKVADIFCSKPATNWIVGACLIGNKPQDAGLNTPLIPSPTWKCLTREYFIPQPSVFLKDVCLRKYGFFDDKLHYCMDYDYWCRLLLSDEIPETTTEPLSFFRLHQDSKTTLVQPEFEMENIAIIRKHMYSAPQDAVEMIHAGIRTCVDLYHHFTARSLRYSKGRIAGLTYLFYMTLRRPSMLRPKFMWNSLKRIFS